MMTSCGRDTLDLFEDLIIKARNMLYPVCTKHSSLKFLVKLMHLKGMNCWRNNPFDMLLKLLSEAFPDGALIPATFSKAKKNFET